MGEYIKKSRKGGFEVSAEFGREKIIFHPIPHSFDSKVREGEEWEGEFKALRETGKKDCYKVPIFSQFFVPTRRVEEWRVESDKFYSLNPPPLPSETFGKATLKSGEVVLREVALSPVKWEISISDLGVTVYPVFSYQEKENTGTGRHFPNEILRQISPEAAETQEKWEKEKEKKFFRWKERNQIKKILPGYWYQGRIDSNNLPEVPNFFLSSTNNVDEEIHIFYSSTWKVVACEDTVILAGEETLKSMGVFELVCFHRWLTIQQAHEAFSVRALSPETAGEDALRFLMVQAKKAGLIEKTGRPEEGFYDSVKEVLAVVHPYLFANRKQNEEINRWADSIVYGKK